MNKFIIVRSFMCKGYKGLKLIDYINESLMITPQGRR